VNRTRGAKQPIPRLTYTRVTAALAILVVLLTGGYSVAALMGTGTLQKENEVGFPDEALEAVRTVKGIGPLRVFCDDGGVEFLALSVLNQSGEELVSYTDSVRTDTGSSADPYVSVALDGGGLGLTEDEPDTGERGVFRTHIFPKDGSKTPQAHLTVGFNGSLGCGDAQVSVLNLTTEE
jgi:hypothetical protein